MIDNRIEKEVEEKLNGLSLKETLAWLAGLFDGEGCVHIDCYQQHYQFGTVIAQSDYLGARIVFEWLKNRYGGGIFIHTSGVLRWDLRSNKAVVFLKDIEPYTILKRRHIKVALRFQSISPGSGHKLSIPARLEKEGLSRTLKILNGNYGVPRQRSKQPLTKEDKKVLKRAEELCKGW